MLAIILGHPNYSGHPPTATAQAAKDLGIETVLGVVGTDVERTFLPLPLRDTGIMRRPHIASAQAERWRHRAASSLTTNLARPAIASLATHHMIIVM